MSMRECTFHGEDCVHRGCNYGSDCKYQTVASPYGLTERDGAFEVIGTKTRTGGCVTVARFVYRTKLNELYFPRRDQAKELANGVVTWWNEHDLKLLDRAHGPGL